jgi:hypothetical protein
MTEDPDQTPAPKSRLEAELLEILERSDREPTPVERIRSNARVARERVRTDSLSRVPRIFRRLGAWTWLVACLALGVIAFVVGDSLRIVAQLAVIACIVVFLFAIFRGGRRAGPHDIKTWRGRDIDLSSPGRPEWLDRMLRGRKKPPKL